MPVIVLTAIFVWNDARRVSKPHQLPTLYPNAEASENANEQYIESLELQSATGLLRPRGSGSEKSIQHHRPP